jgi:peroxiredoxin
MKSRWIIAAAAAAALGLLTLPVFLSSRTKPAGQLVASHASCRAEGQADLDFTLQDMNGASVRLADYKGKVILLNFWATWCGPCKLEIPEFVHTYAANKDKGFVILGVSIDDTPEQLRAFATEYKMNYPSLLLVDKLEEAYGPLYGVPISVFIGRDGSICRKHMGPLTKEQLEQELEALL